MTQISAKLDEAIRECKAPLSWMHTLGNSTTVIAVWVTALIMWFVIRKTHPVEEASDLTAALTSVWALLILVGGAKMLKKWIPAWCLPRICFAIGIFGKKRAETYARRRNIGVVGIVASAVLGVVVSKVLG